MINLNNKEILRLKNCYVDGSSERTSINVLKSFGRKSNFSVFKIFEILNTRTIIYDDDKIGFVTWKDDKELNYLILSANRSVEQMRYDACCMLGKLIRKLNSKDKNVNYNMSNTIGTFSRDDKHFACAMLMPSSSLIKFITRKENNKYVLLDQNGELPIENINIIADHFGVPFNQCFSRIFNYLDDLANEGKRPFKIKDCHSKRAYNRLKENYSNEERTKDLERLIPEYNDHRREHAKHLIDSLHYRFYCKLSDISKKRILYTLIASDSINERVVSIKNNKEETYNSVIDILNRYNSGGIKVRDGYLITPKHKKIPLTDEQLVILGEYDLYKKTLERGLFSSIGKVNGDKHMYDGMKAIDVLNSLSEKDISYFICQLHRKLFAKISFKYGEDRGGMYRTGPVTLANTNVDVPDYRLIPQLMDNISWRIKQILIEDCKKPMKNSEFMHEINSCIYDLIRIQPFPDGNKRTARLLSNILYREQGLPYVLIPVSQWDNYVDAWSSNDIKEYDDMMYKLIFDSFSYFYGNQSIEEAIDFRTKGQEFIMANRER